MCGDEGRRVRQFVMSPHPEREENHSNQSDDGDQGVEQSAEELGLLGKWVGGGCMMEGERERERETPPRGVKFKIKERKNTSDGKKEGKINKER